MFTRLIYLQCIEFLRNIESKISIYPMSEQLFNTKVCDVMMKTVATVDMDDNLATVKEIFDNTTFHHLLVVENDRLFSVISDRDLFKALSPNIGKISESNRDFATLNKRVHQIMTRSPITLDMHASIHYLFTCFESYSISCLPVLDQDNKPVGIISWRDLLKFLRKYLEAL